MSALLSSPPTVTTTHSHEHPRSTSTICERPGICSFPTTASSGGGVNLLFSYRDSHSQPHKNRSKQKSRILQRLKVHATKQNDGICTLCLRCKGERQAIQHLQENLPEVGAFLPSFLSDLGREKSLV